MSQEQTRFPRYLNHEDNETRGAGNVTPPDVIFHYPALEKLFAPGAQPAAMRARFERTRDDLERVIRHGSAADAAAARKAALAWRLSLDFLDELQKTMV
ncbi:MAG: hypothetical protein ACKV2V_16560 [Blastocatellia bacterium]